MEYFFSRRQFLGPNLHFSAKPGQETSYVKVTQLSQSGPSAGLRFSAQKWAKEVLATSRNGHVLIVVHGYRVLQNSFLQNVSRIRQTCQQNGFKGAVIGFDWPANGNYLDYGKDKTDANTTAPYLVIDGIRALLRHRPTAKIHLLAHSMGAYVVTRALGLAIGGDMEGPLKQSLQQVMFTAGDVNENTMKANAWGGQTFAWYGARLTNYWSGHDQALQFPENTFYPGSRRIGRNPYPHSASSKLTAVDCTDYYHRNYQLILSPAKSHNFYYGDGVFYADLIATMLGRSKESMWTRAAAPDGHQLMRP